MWWQWRKWFSGRQPSTARRVVLYHRAGCHLCDSARDLLRAAQERYGFTLEVVDVDEDPALVALYSEQVPVVSVDGKVRFRGIVNPALFKRLLEGSRDA
jgi:glutaredoxin